MKERRPIFYDVEKLRWHRTRRVLEVTGALLTILLVYFFFTIVITVDLPAVLSSTRQNYRAFHAKPRGKPAAAREGRKQRIAAIGKIPEKYDPLRAAFYVSWDPASLASLKNHVHRSEERRVGKECRL